MTPTDTRPADLVCGRDVYGRHFWCRRADLSKQRRQIPLYTSCGVRFTNRLPKPPPCVTIHRDNIASIGRIPA